MDTDYVLQECKALNPRLIEWRRLLHRIPESGIDLPETEAAVGSILENLNVGLQKNYRGVGLVAVLEGEKASQKTVAIRADMDALALEEEPGRKYGSTHPGMMHACGHDAHVAMALGAASFFSQHRQDLPGTIKFIFQPGEESMGGAQRMLEAGALDNPRADCLLGLHIGDIWPEVGLGQVGVCFKPMMAAADAFEFTMEAAGGHGAAPHRSSDPVLAASFAVTQIHTLVSRCIDPLDQAVVTVGQINGGTACNIIPTEVTARGTVRTFNEKNRELIETRLAEIVAHAADSFHCRHRYNYYHGTHTVENDPATVECVRQSALDILGPDLVRDIERPTLISEDVSVFLREIPGCFFALGASNPGKNRISLHHSPVFDIDESVLWQGTAVFCQSALRLLGAR
jgi:amidohydrolase